MLHAYPSMERIAEIRDAQIQGCCSVALGPAGDVVVTARVTRISSFGGGAKGVQSGSGGCIPDVHGCVVCAAA